jgi:hypothetical protein
VSTAVEAVMAAGGSDLEKVTGESAATLGKLVKDSSAAAQSVLDDANTLLKDALAAFGSVATSEDKRTIDQGDAAVKEAQRSLDAKMGPVLTAVEQAEVKDGTAADLETVAKHEAGVGAIESEVSELKTKIDAGVAEESMFDSLDQTSRSSSHWSKRAWLRSKARRSW